MREFFKRWKWEAIIVASLPLVFTIYSRIRQALTEYDHAFLGPLFILSQFMIFLVSLICLEVGIRFVKPGMQLVPILAGLF